MAKFCKKCGTPLPADSFFCPECGNDIIRPAVTKATTPVNEETTISSTSKKKTKLPVILVTATALLLVLTIILGTVTAGTLFFFRDKEFIRAGNDLVFENKYGIFCIEEAALLNTNYIEKGYVVEDDNVSTLHTNYNAICIDETLYYIREDFYKATFKDNTTCKIEVWISSDEFEKSTEKEFNGLAPQNIDTWQYSQDYFYFSTKSTSYDTQKETEIQYQLGRINLKTKKIEKIGNDIAPISFLVDGDWIYYSESGYNRNTEKYDYNKAGIYKIRTDGTGNKKLLDLKYEKAINGTAFLYTDLSLFDGKIYFVQADKKSGRKIYRINKSGNNLKEVSSSSVQSYTIDAERNTLYYVSDNFDDSSTVNIREVSLNNLFDHKLADCNDTYGKFSLLEVYDDKLYIKVPSPYSEHNYNSYVYYDIIKKRVYGIFRNQDYKFYTEEYSGDLYKFNN